MFTVLLLCLTLLLGSQGQDYEEVTSPTDYDYNSTFDYHFYSNTSNEDLDQFLKEREEFITSEEEEEEVTGKEEEVVEEKNGEEEEKNEGVKEEGEEEKLEEAKETTTVRTKVTSHVHNHTASLPSLLSTHFWILLVFLQHTL